ncbi:phosphoenolpyruvate carboxykinase (ATP) (plasmid) [Nitrobacter sp. NHB1]|uniref:phosphoenolpyruvate carboxykinase (ATP) n=1 Tax=Nitrobacter sp. NHB1 TaxID=3119830 RepID=UPI002FFE70A4
MKFAGAGTVRTRPGGEAQLRPDGALCAETGLHTERSPKDKYIVCDDVTDETVWWENNGKMRPAQFAPLYQDQGRLHDDATSAKFKASSRPTSWPSRCTRKVRVEIHRIGPIA